MDNCKSKNVLQDSNTESGEGNSHLKSDCSGQQPSSPLENVPDHTQETVNMPPSAIIEAFVAWILSDEQEDKKDVSTKKFDFGVIEIDDKFRKTLCQLYFQEKDHYNRVVCLPYFPNGLTSEEKKQFKKKGLACSECGEIFSLQHPRGHATICKKAPDSCDECGLVTYQFLAGAPHQVGCSMATQENHHTLTHKEIFGSFAPNL